MLATLKAGSGKSYLVKHIIAALTDNPQDDVAFIAPTGKAATVLQQNGNPNPMTAHKLLYYTKQNKYGKYYFEPKETLDGSYRIIVCDEVSMLSAKIWQQLMKHNVYVLALGDPGQLPAVSGFSNGILEHPHVFLDEIMRQALDSEIIRLSMHVRQGRPLSTFPCKNQDVMIFNKWELTPDMMLWADQCLCATNGTRIKNNLFMRQLKGYYGDPQVGEKIIGLTNHWDCLSDEEYDAIALTNGAIGTITRIEKTSLWAPPQVGYSRIPIFNLDIETTDGHKFSNLNVDYNSLVKGQKLLTDLQEMKMKRSTKCGNPPYDFNYSDWISVHRFQGSQADKILIQEENFPFSREDHIKWIYTGCTRASKKLVIIKK